MEIQIEARDLYTVPEAARALGRSVMTLYRWIDHGKLVTVRLGRNRFVPVSEVERLRKKLEDR